jgi:hypothetical protein
MHEDMEAADFKGMPTKPKGGRILEFFRQHPLLGFLGCLGSIASIVALPYTVFPWLGGPKRDLSYCIAPIRVPIVQSVKTSDVTVSYRGQPVSGNVTAVQIAIWNAGREPIRGDDLLTPVVLHTPEDVVMMEVAPLKITRDVIGFKLATTKAPSSAATLSWKILEHNDGVVLQVVYAGSVGVPLKLEGTIIGQQSPHEKSAAHVGKVPLLQRALVLFLPLCMLFSANLIVKDVFRGLRSDWKNRLRRVAIIRGLAGLGLVAGCVYVVWFFGTAFYRASVTVTPFDF